jgi:hypothetical protein
VKLLLQRYFELTFWITALLLLAFMNPGTEVHYSLCPFKLAGIHFCPGCGLGHSISFLFHGDFQSSLKAHPLGLFAVITIVYRIYQLSLLHIFHKNQKNFYAIRK